MMSYDELELEKLGDEKTALFAVVSDTDPTFNFISAMMYSQIAKALNGAFSYGSMADFYNRSPEKTPICPEFSKTAVRMKKHIRPPVRAEPERGLLQSKNQTDNISTCFLNSRRILL